MEREDNLRLLRIVAAICDLILYFIGILFTSTALLIVFYYNGADVSGVTYDLMVFGVGVVVYILVPLLLKGRTLGKVLCGLVVVNAKDNSKVTILQNIFRNPVMITLMVSKLYYIDIVSNISMFINIILWLTCFVAFIQVLITKNTTFLDILLGTKVISRVELRNEKHLLNQARNEVEGWAEIENTDEIDTSSGKVKNSTEDKKFYDNVGDDEWL